MRGYPTDGKGRCQTECLIFPDLILGKQTHFGGCRLRRSALRTVSIAAATIGLVFSQGAASADDFGPGFSSAWKFRSDSDRAVRAGVVDLMERKAAGQFQAPTYNVTNTTNIAGDQINCDLAATTVGNTGNSSNNGQSGAPSVLNSPAVTASATGNIAGGETGGPLNAGGGTGTNTINTDQSVTGSTQSSTAGQTDQGGVTGNVGGSTSTLAQTARNEQAVTNSPLNSSVSDSAACRWR
jgi:hypothetical protein